MTDADRPPLDERLTTKSAMETGVAEGVAAFPDQMAEPVDLALDRLDAMSARPDLTVAEAARLAKVNPRTIRRRLSQGSVLPNAHRDASGQWLIPPDDLVAAGFDLADTDPSEPDLSTPESTPVIDSPVDSPQPAADSVSVAPDAQYDWRTRAIVAEALMDEKDARLAEKDRTLAAKDDALDALRVTVQALRALGTGAGTMALNVTPSRPEPTDDTDLRAELADALRRAEVAEQRRGLAEHDRNAARASAAGVKGVRGSDLPFSNRSGGSAPTPATSTKPLPPPSLPPARRRWWSRS
jgi:hypothetical protein